MSKTIKNESGNALVMVLFVVVGLVIGFAAGRVLSTNSDKKSSSSSSSSAKVAPDTATKAADLRSTLVKLGLEHMALTDQAVAAALDGTANAKATGAALYANGDDIGAAVGSVYGKDAEATFNTVWKLHLDEFVKYAVASKTGNAAGKDAALKAINDGYTVPLSDYLAKANPNLPADVLKKVLGEHVAMTAVMIDAHVAGNYEEEAAQLKKANDHIEVIFSTLAGAIVKQYPEKF